MRIKTSELRQATLLILKQLESSNQKEFDVEEDFYWSIPQKQRYDNYDEPNEFLVGQLTDDWAEVRKIIDHQSDPVGYSLVWLSSILRIIGEKTME